MSTMHLTLDNEYDLEDLAVGTLLVNSRTGETWRRLTALPRTAGVKEFLRDWARTDREGFARQADEYDYADLWEARASGHLVVVWMPRGARLPQ